MLTVKHPCRPPVLLLQPTQPLVGNLHVSQSAAPGGLGQFLQARFHGLGEAIEHRQFLGDAVLAAAEDQRLACIAARQLDEFNFDALPDLLPAFIGDLSLHLPQQRLGRAHDVLPAALADEGQVGLRHIAPVHHPDAFGLAVLGLHLLDDPLHGGRVGRVAVEDFVAQGITIRGHDQGDHHLHAVAAAVARIAPLGLGIGRALALKIRAGQVVQEHVIGQLEELTQPLTQILLDGLLLLEQFIQAGVQPVGMYL